MYLFIICFSFLKFAYLTSYAESKARPPSALNVGIGFFCPGKGRITHMTHYHTFYTPQKWCDMGTPDIYFFAEIKKKLSIKHILSTAMLYIITII